MTNLSHLNSLEASLARETVRLENSKTSYEVEMRTVWVSQIKKEISGEYKFIGIQPLTEKLIAMSDDELLSELMA